MKNILLTTRCLILAALTGGGFALQALASEPSAISLATNATVNANAVRRTHSLNEAELKDLLTAALQRDRVRDRGELELRFTRPWSPVTVPDEPVTVSILDMPTAGVSPNFIVRFELRTSERIIGTWQMPVQAHIWREVWVARSPLKRGQLLSDVDRVKERRDMLAMRDACLADVADESLYEIAEAVPAGAPLYVSSAQLRRLVRRGQVAEAVVQDGAMLISLKVEVLEDGVLGQFVRVRNPQSKREFRGRVQNEQTILVSL
jgi:flagellar basal body P-ring formation protein FlgA